MYRNFLALGIFFLLSFLSFSESKLSFKVNSASGIVQYTDLDTGNKDFVKFSKNFSSFDIPNGNYKIRVYSKHFIDFETIVSLFDEHKAYNIILQEKKDTFFISALESNISKILFSKSNLNQRYLSDLEILFYKGDVLVKTLDLETPITKTELDFGLYKILVYKNEDLIFSSDEIQVNESSESFLNILLEINNSKVNGKILIGDLSLGGVKVTFTSVDNSTYEFISDISGVFKGNLPNKKYKVSIDKYGYKLKDGYDLIYDFTSHSSLHNVNLEVEEIKSIVKGKVIDELGNPIQDALVTIGLDKESSVIATDSYGRFEAEVDAGTIFIRSTKDGYSHKGLVKRLEKASTLSNLEITMQRNLFYIKGLISDGISPIKKQRIDIVDSVGKRIASTLSGDNGYFEFFDIPSDDSLFLKASIQGFNSYTSKEFKLNKNINNHIILLENEHQNIVLSFLDSTKKPLSNAVVLINDDNYTTDFNGMLYLASSYEFIDISYQHFSQSIPLNLNSSIYEIKITDKETN